MAKTPERFAVDPQHEDAAALPNGWRSAAVEPAKSRRGHERSECLGAFQSSTASSNAR